MTSRPGGRTAGGFTLIEVMITVAIVAIIALVALPSYQESVIKSRRSDGQIGLAMLAQRLERCYTQFGRYDAADCAIDLPMASPEGFYLLDAATLAAGEFTLNAVPQGAQSRDSRCGTLALDSRGQRSASGAQPDKC